MLKAIGNVMPRHLLDRRLDPTRALEQQVAPALDAIGDVRSTRRSFPCSPAAPAPAPDRRR